MNRKLGKLPKREDPRTLKIAKYLTGEAITFLPSGVDWTVRATQPWGMMQNDALGDCTCAAAGHMIQAWTANAGTEVTVPDSAIVKAYQDVGGYVPGDESTDNGANMLDLLKYWRKTGIGGHKIGAFVEVDPSDRVQMRAAHWLFGGPYLGLNLPLSAQTQAVWDVASGPNGNPGSWGGHAVSGVRYSVNQAALVTWGDVQPYTYAFLAKYADEAYAVLSPDWLTKDGGSVQGFDLATLQADLGKLGVL